MSLLVLADVSLPAKVSFVDRRNEQVHLVGGSVLEVHVDSLLGPLSLDLSVLLVARAVVHQRLTEPVLSLFAVLWLRQRSTREQVLSLNFLIRLNNLVPLQFAVVVGFTLLKWVLLHLSTMEALDRVLSHGACFASYLRYVLHEADHGLSALGVELVVVTSLNLLELRDAVRLSSG